VLLFSFVVNNAKIRKFVRFLLPNKEDKNQLAPIEVKSFFCKKRLKRKAGIWIAYMPKLFASKKDYFRIVLTPTPLRRRGELKTGTV
jgi:hypothetical protein